MYRRLEPSNQMVYSCVCEGKQIEVDHALHQTNLADIVKQLLSANGIKPNCRMSYNYQDLYHLHSHNEENRTYLVVSNSEFPKRVAFMFLEDIRERYKKSASNFKPTLAERLNYYNNNQDLDKITKIRQNIDEVNNIMLLNIDKVLQRGEKIEVLLEKAGDMEEKARVFRKNAAGVRKEYCCQYYRNKIIVGLLILAAIGAVVFVIYINVK